MVLGHQDHPSFLISGACAKSTQWSSAWALLGCMSRCQLVADVRSYSDASDSAAQQGPGIENKRP